MCLRGPQRCACVVEHVARQHRLLGDQQGLADLALRLVQRIVVVLEDDLAIVDRMAKGKLMVVKGTSPKGTYAEDHYSLNGFTKARRAMKDLCK